jgi:carboxyl-terminal processing protease
VPQGDTLVEARLQRRNILIESVVGDYRDGDNRWVYRLKDHPEIAYLRVSSFGEKTAMEIRGAIEGLGEGVTGLILDVRGNAGGLLNAAVEVCDDFLEEGRIVTIKRRGGEIDTEFEAIPGAIVPMGLPMVVLIDGDSASASEVVAACLQDHGRAKLVGVRSFGKGTVQNVLPLQGGRSALKLTTARYYRPNGQNIHRLDAAPDDDLWGVRPDQGFEVPMSNGSRRRLNESWQIRSFPVALQETILRQQAGSKGSGAKDDAAGAKAAGRQRNGSEDDRGESPGDGDNSEPIEQGAGDQEPVGPVVDPVLNRAVDHLKSLPAQAQPNESQKDAEPNVGAAKRAA